MGIRIEVDYRERSSGVLEILKGKERVSVKERNLSLGNYRINDRIIVERKTTKDFVISIIDGRLFSQVSRLKCSTMRSVLIIEGSDLYSTGYDIDPQAIKGAITSLSISWYIPVVFSSDADGTAEFLIMAAIQDLEYLTEPGKRSGRRPKRLENRKLYILQGLPDVGPKIAKSMLERFGSVEKAITADEQELALVKGIGSKRATIIKKVLG